jgi:hypothetical protein
MEADPKTVVVAEDEILIRILAVEVLTDAGFEVIEAGNGRGSDHPAIPALGNSSTVHGYSYARTDERSGAGASREAELAARGVAYRIRTRQAAFGCASGGQHLSDEALQS